MAGAKLDVPHETFLRQSDRHTLIASGLSSIDPTLQRLIAELVMMRMFDEFQFAMAGIAKRLVCGAQYLDGSSPILLCPIATSTANAEQLIRTLGRQKATHPKWSTATYINDATRYVIDQSDHFTRIISGHGAIIKEMQAVRNRIAHNNPNSRIAFSRVIAVRYGARNNAISPGLLLLTPRFSPNLLDQYVRICRTIVKSCVRA